MRYFNLILSSVVALMLCCLFYAGIKYENIGFCIIATAGMTINFFMLKHDVSKLKG